MAIDISHVAFSIAWENHPRDVSGDLAEDLVGAGGATWSETDSLQSCALRLSYALHRAGVKWPRSLTSNQWQLQSTGEYLPTRAGDYPDMPLLCSGESLTGSVTEKLVSVMGRKGVLYFGGQMNGATGHVTLFDGNRTHYPDIDNFWSQPTVVFWEIMPRRSGWIYPVRIGYGC